MIILPSTYLPSIEHVTALLKGDAVIDIGEHYIKRSPRNRARIMTANGVMELSVPLVRANRPRTPMYQIQIDYSKRWQHQHWVAIVSAYKSSPYFDHFEPYLKPIFNKHWERLVDLNSELLKVILKLLRTKATFTISESYIDAKESDTDLRAKGATDPEFTATPYIQVFADRFEFEPNLSILDLLFNEGSII